MSARDRGRRAGVEHDERRLLAPELFGREVELAVLEAALAGTAGGNGRLVLVGGDAGIGKTALLRSFIGHARSAREAVLIGECSETASAQPFGPFVEILRAAFAAFPSELVERSLRGHARDLVRFLPERTAGQIEPSGGSERFQSHESFAMFFADLARSKPLVLAVEDIQFADPATLELLPYLARRVLRERVLLLLTYRSDELHRLHPLRPVLAELQRSPQTVLVRIGPLGTAETTKMLEAILGRAHSAGAFRHALDEVCEGNPLFIEEVLKTLAQRGDLVYRDGEWRRDKEVRDIAIPDSVNGAVGQRVHALTTDAQRVLRVAAVIGRRFDFDVLQEVSELPERTVLDALAAALETQLIVAAGDPREDQFAFRHALTREAVLGELLQREQRSLHRSVGRALERRAAGDPTTAADALAYHFDEAGDADSALRYHQVAADQASRVFAFAAAVRHLERACALAPHDPRALADLHLQLSEAAKDSHQYRRALEAAATARALCVELSDADGTTAALSCMAICHFGLGDIRSATLLADEAVRGGAPHGGRALAEAYRTAMFVAFQDWDYQKVHDLANEAVRVARESGSSMALVEAMTLVGITMVYQRREAEGIARVRETLVFARERNALPELEYVLFQLGNVLRYVGAPRIERRAAFEERLRLCRERGYRNDTTLWSEVELAFIDGEWDRIPPLLADLQDTVWSAIPALTAAFAGAAREGPERFLAPAMEARHRMLALPNWASVAAGTAALSWLAGDARATLEQAAVVAEAAARLEGPEHARHWAASGHLGPAAIFALLAAESLGDVTAVDHWTELMSLDQLGPEPQALTAARLFARARRAAREGEAASALALLAEAEPLLAEGELPFALTVTRLERADLLLRRGASGDRAAAAEELAAALTYWERANATWYLAALRRWAARRKLPFPAASPPPSARDVPATVRNTTVLSRREHEVAELVAQGMTNAEIANRLTITLRTAEAHVEHIRNKLGFHSRVQIGAWVARTLVDRS